jgi:hypothetical protein
MFWWLPRPRARIKRLDTEADALICGLGVDAYAEARRKECEASSDTIARDWGRVAAAVAKRTGLDVVHRRRRDADLALGSEPVAPSQLRPNSEPGSLDRLNGSVFARPQQFRVQFVGAARGREPLLLKEAGVDAADVSAAVVAAASLTLPPKTNGLHILDREGRVVFVRARTNPRLQSLSRQEPQVSLSDRRPWGLSRSGVGHSKPNIYFSVMFTTSKADAGNRLRSTTPGGTSSVTR